MAQAIERVGREPITDQTPPLQDTLIELIELSLQAKQAHWNVVGPTFKSIHEFLDVLTDEYRAWYDVVAERLAAIGSAPDGRSATIVAATPFAQLPAGSIAGEAVIGLFDERITAFAVRLRERIDQLADTDLASQGILIEILAGVEKQRWMLRAHGGA